MGSVLTYCVKCGVRLVPNRFQDGGAIQVGDRTFCEECLPPRSRAQAVLPAEPATPARPIARRPSSSRVAAPAPRPVVARKDRGAPFEPQTAARRWWPWATGGLVIVLATALWAFGSGVLPARDLAAAAPASLAVPLPPAPPDVPAAVVSSNPPSAPDPDAWTPTATVPTCPAAHACVNHATVPDPADSDALGGAAPAGMQSQRSPRRETVIGNSFSRKAHRPSCANLPSEHNRRVFADADEAQREGYSPCRACRPW